MNIVNRTGLKSPAILCDFLYRNIMVIVDNLDTLTTIILVSLENLDALLCDVLCSG